MRIALGFIHNLFAIIAAGAMVVLALAGLEAEKSNQFAEVGWKLLWISVVAIPIFAVVYGSQMAIYLRAKRKAWLDYYASFLWSGLPEAQLFAVRVLSMMLGDRFGQPKSSQKEAVSYCVSLWQGWWLAHGHQLVFDPIIDRYILVDAREEPFE